MASPPEKSWFGEHGQAVQLIAVRTSLTIVVGVWAATDVAIQLESAVIRSPAKRGTRITPEEIDAVTEERVLLATGTFPDPTVFNEDFAALSPELVDQFHERGVRLIGIDTPSVDLFSSKDLPAHARFLANDMAILEGLVLTDVAPGRYELIALPLPLVGFDASPVRAILREIPVTTR